MRRVKDLLFLVLCLSEFRACLVFSLDTVDAFGTPGAAGAKPTILNPKRSQPGILWDEGVEPGALPRLSSSSDVPGFAGQIPMARGGSIMESHPQVPRPCLGNPCQGSTTVF